MKSKFKNQFITIIDIYKKNLKSENNKYLILQEWMIFLDFFIDNEGISKLNLINNNKQTLPKNILDFYSKKKIFL